MALLATDIQTAIAVDANSGVVKSLYETMYLMLDVTAAAAGTLDVEVEWSMDGNTFFSHSTPDVFTQVVASAIKEIQDVDDGDATAGDFKLRVDDSDGVELGTTAVIVFNETAANVQIALNAIPGVTVGLPTGVGSVADPYVITFNAPIENLPLMTIVDDTTTGGAGAQVVANQDGSSESWLSGVTAKAAFFRLNYTVDTGPHTFTVSAIGF